MKTEVTMRRAVVFLIMMMILAVVGTMAINLSFDTVEKTFVAGLDIDSGDKKIIWGRYEKFDVELSESFEIKKSGIYHLAGKIENGMVTVDVGDYGGVVKLILDNVTMNNETGPAIYVKSADDIVIETADGTENFLLSGENFETFSEDENVEGTIYSKGDLSFCGNGRLFVESRYKDAIVSKDDLAIRSGEIEIVAADDGIRGKDSVFIENGKIKVNARQDGIKSTNIEEAGKGFIYIENGDVEISAGDDGIHAVSSLIVMNGRVNVRKSYEGIEGAKVVINNGEINIVSIDDGINAAGGKDESAFARPGAEKFAVKDEYYIMVNGGNLYINSAGDGIDSNGKIYLNGGKVMVDGPVNSANGALDSEDGIYFNGGVMIAAGASEMTENFQDSSLASGVSFYFEKTQTKNTLIEVKDENGNVIISHTFTKSFNHMTVGSENFEQGHIYNIYANGEFLGSARISGTVTVVGKKEEEKSAAGEEMTNMLNNG